MRKKFYILAAIFIAIFVVGCSNDTETDTSAEDATNEESLSNDEDSNEETENTKADGPIIDPNNPHNEREEIIMMVEEQKELLKLGFVKEDTVVDAISMHRYVEVDEEDMYPEDYDTGYSGSYRAENSDYSISLATEAFVCQDGLDEWSSDLEEREAFGDDRIEGYYGHAEHGSSNIFIKHHDICYAGFISGDDDVYDEKDQRLLELLTETVKTEEEGAYDPIYSRFTIDLQSIKFPALNQASTSLRSVRIAYSEEKFDPSYSEISVTYGIGEDIISLEITDEEEPTKGVDFLEELQTGNGVTVSKYEDTTLDREFFHWQDDGLTYIIDVSNYHREITEEEVFEIIDSTIEDDRSFENLEFFQGVNDDADLDDAGLEILEDYYY